MRIINIYIVDYNFFGDSVRKPAMLKLYELENGEWYTETPSQNGYLQKVDLEDVNKALGR